MKVYTSEEISNATELECHYCEAKLKTNPNILKLTDGWERMTIDKNQKIFL